MISDQDSDSPMNAQDAYRAIQQSIEHLREDYTDIRVGVATHAEKMGNIERQLDRLGKRFEESETHIRALQTHAERVRGGWSVIDWLRVAAIPACIWVYEQFRK